MERIFKLGDKARHPTIGLVTVTGLRHYQNRYIVDVSCKDGVQRAYYENEVVKENKMLDSVKEYMKEHKNVIITIGVVLLVDHLVLGGALRQKVQSLLESFLNKAQKQLDDK